MPENTMRIDRHTPGIRLDRLITQKASEVLNAMPDASGRRDRRGVQIYECSGGWKAYRSPEPRHAPVWRHAGESELIIVPWTAMTKSAQPFGLPCYQQLFAILQILGLLLAIYFVSAL